MTRFHLMYLIGFVFLIGGALGLEHKSVQAILVVLLANIWFVGAHICDAIDAKPQAAPIMADEVAISGGSNG